MRTHLGASGVHMVIATSLPWEWVDIKTFDNRFVGLYHAMWKGFGSGQQSQNGANASVWSKCYVVHGARKKRFEQK